MYTNYSKGNSAMKSVTIFTSNIVNWSKVQKKLFSTSSEEILDCCKCVIKCWKAHCSKGGKFLPNLRIECSKHRDYIDLDIDPNIRITIKIFMYSSEVSDLEDAFKSISKNVVTSSFSTLILCFPKEVLDIHQVLNLWQFLESKVAEHKVWRLGVSDLNLSQLMILCDNSKIPPSVNQIYGYKACSISQDLKDYTHDHDIELLLHNDDLQMLSSEKLNEILNEELQSNSWVPRWVVKYSTIFANRSVIRSLGYMLHAVVAASNGVGVHQVSS